MNAQIHLIATDSKGPIALVNSGTQLILTEVPAYQKNIDKGIEDGTIKPQHLYITIDEEIKEGDWFIANQAPRLCIKVEKDTKYPFVTLQDGEEISHFWTWKTKIVATTNSELWWQGLRNEADSVRKPLIPPIHQSFIDIFINSYNKGEIIKEVVLEIEIIDKTKEWSNFNNPLINLKEQLKLNFDGSVIIKLKEDETKLKQLAELLESRGVRKYLNINDFGYSQIERDIVELFNK